MSRHRHAGLFGALALGMAAGIVLVACDGDNLFGPTGGPGEGPGVVGAPSAQITTPGTNTAQPVGDSLLVKVQVTDRGGIRSVTLRGVALRGEPTLGTDTVVTKFTPKTVSFPDSLAPTDTLVQRFLQPAEDQEREDVFVVAEVVDVDGEESTDTVGIVLGGPRVQIANVEEGDAFAAGQEMAPEIRVFDPDGITAVELVASGAFSATVDTVFGVPVSEETTFTLALAVPSGARGEFTIQARARSTRDLQGESEPVTVEAIAPTVSDSIAPEVKLEITASARMERTDSVEVRVTGRDDTGGRGVRVLGYTVRAHSPIRGTTVIRSDSVTFDPARSGEVARTLRFAPFNDDPTFNPDTLVFSITGWAVDGGGNCGAGVSAEEFQRLTCTGVSAGAQTFHGAQGTQGQAVTTAVVSGRTVLLPTGGFIADAAIDPELGSRPLMVLSNFEQDRLEIFDLVEEEFEQAVLVGSEPWGLAYSRTNTDSVFVANSGGTNISQVYMGTTDDDPSRREYVPGRILTPNTNLFEVDETVSESGRVVLSGIFHDFSDRPQFLAQDASGRVVYSTKPTGSAPNGTIRLVESQPGWNRPEVRLFFEHGEIEEADTRVAIAGIDSLVIVVGGAQNATGSDGLVLYDHEPGFPNNTVQSPPLTRDSAIAVMESDPASDIFAVPGTWNVESIGLSDTTFVSASGDGEFVAFGEGATAPTGRVMLFESATTRISDVVSVVDLVGNAAERVFGVDLNADGSLGVARGAQAYFFSNDLRLQGVADLPQGGAGAALHPLHDQGPVSTNPNTRLAFIGTGDGTVDIIDTVHFFRTGRVFIRDVVVGPLRTSLPFVQDNAGLSCGDRTASGAIRLYADANGQVINTNNDDECVVAKVFGVTSAGGVVVVDVTKADATRDHPARQ